MSIWINYYRLDINIPCHQDLYVERLMKDMEKLTTQTALYEVQVKAQAEETQTAKEALAEVTIRESRCHTHTTTVTAGGLVAQWLRLWPRMCKVPGSNPALHTRCVLCLGAPCGCTLVKCRGQIYLYLNNNNKVISFYSNAGY